MNFDELQKTWAKQSVAGTHLATAELPRRLEAEVRQRSRKILRVIGVAAFVFAVAWVTAIAAHVTGILRFTPVSFTAFLIVTGLDVVFLIGGVRAYRRMKHEAASMSATLREATRSSLRAVTWQMRDCVLFGYALALAVLTQAGVSVVRYGLGDARGGMALANVGFMAVVAFAVALRLRRYYRTELVPRRNELTRELAELEAG